MRFPPCSYALFFTALLQLAPTQQTPRNDGDGLSPFSRLHRHFLPELSGLAEGITGGSKECKGTSGIELDFPRIEAMNMDGMRAQRRSVLKLWKLACVGTALSLSTLGTGRVQGQQGTPGRATQATATPIHPTAVKLVEVKHFSVPTGPKSLRFTPDGRYVVVNCLYGHLVTVLDSHTYQIVRKIKVPDEPVECAFTEGGKTAWVSLYNKHCVLAIELETGKILATIPVGSVPKVVTVSPDDHWVYVANWSSSSITIIDTITRKRVKDISVGRLPRGICFDHGGKIAYVAIMGGTTLVKIDTAHDHKKVGAIAAGVTPRHIVCQADDKTLYVSNNLPGTITRIDLDKQNAVATIQVGKMPRTIALSPEGDLLYVCNYQSGNLGIIDTARNRQVQQIKTRTHPIGVTVSPDGRFIWVSSYNTSVVQVFERQ
jgi:YVTN family beta-propeller protein